MRDSLRESARGCVLYRSRLPLAAATAETSGAEEATVCVRYSRRRGSPVLQPFAGTVLFMEPAAAERVSKPQAGAASSAPGAASCGDSHLRLLHAALSVSDSARREAERDNAALREELAGLQEQLALVLARATASRAVAAAADENCGVSAPPPNALAQSTPAADLDSAEGVCSTAAPEAPHTLAVAPRHGDELQLPDADDGSARDELLRRRARALGLAGSALFPKAMHRV